MIQPQPRAVPRMTRGWLAGQPPSQGCLETASGSAGNTCVVPSGSGAITFRPYDRRHFAPYRGGAVTFGGWPAGATAPAARLALGRRHVHVGPIPGADGPTDEGPTATWRLRHPRCSRSRSPAASTADGSPLEQIGRA